MSRRVPRRAVGRWARGPLDVAGAAFDLVHSLVGQARAEGGFSLDLDAIGPLSVQVDNGAGAVWVQGGPEERVVVEARVVATAGSEDDAHDVVSDVAADPPVRLEDGALLVGRYVHWWPGVSISYDITVPRSSALEGHTGSGALTVEGIAGPVEIETGSGAVTVDDVAGRVRAETGSGRVKARSIGGRLLLSTGSGAIKVSDVDGDVDATTGSGAIKVDGCVAAVRLTTGSGAIDLRLGNDSGYALDATTGSGRIAVSHDLDDATVTKRSLRGTWRGGGRDIVLRTRSGRISVT